jgi:acetyl esterase/lipase
MRRPSSRPSVDPLEPRRLLSGRVDHLQGDGRAASHRLNESNIVYTTDSTGAHRLDVHLPSGTAPAGGWPVVLAIHGGGWRGGDKLGYEGVVDAELTAAGYAVVAPDYTLSRPGHSSWPLNLNEVRQSVRWVKENAAGFDFDSSAIAAMGESAGAHLALMLGTDPGPADSKGVKARVEAVVDFYGPTDLTSLYNESPAAGLAVSQYIGGKPTQFPAQYANASPVTHISAATPPVLIVHGTADQLVPFTQSVELAQDLSADGVPNQLIPVEGAPHGFGLVVNGIDLGPSVVEFLRQTLGR